MDFKDVVKNIEESEKRVDEVLKAGRLDRHEKQPMSKEKLAMILSYITGNIAMILGFIVLIFVIYQIGGR